MKLYYDNDADLALLKNKTVAVIGYGSQGHAHALNLHESGVSVVVGLRPESDFNAKVKADGLTALPTSEAVKMADLVMILIPDQNQRHTYEHDIKPHLKADAALVFAHGFNIHYNQIVPPAGTDVFMVAPKGPGHLVRRVYKEGFGVPCLFAVHQNASGKAREFALAYAKGIGGTRAGVIETTFREETETDLFGEQAVLCGGASELIKAGFKTLVDAGYQPEIAYFECLHELKLIVDLFYEGGLAGMYHSVSDTAEYGGMTVGPKVIDESTQERMKLVLQRVQDGSFAREFIMENQTGRAVMTSLRRQHAELQLEQVGKTLRGMMSWINKK